MRVIEAIKTRRSIRRFKKKPVPLKVLEGLVDCARLAPSAANLQPCEFIIVNKPRIAARVFSTLKWAGYIAPAGNPPSGRRPVAYIVVLLNRKKRRAGGERDAAAAIENMILAALEKGLGSCWVGSIQRKKLAQILKVPSHCTIDSVLCLGYPDERPVLEEIPEQASLQKDAIKYYKDRNGHLHVPKRRLRELIHYNRYRSDDISRGAAY